MTDWRAEAERLRAQLSVANSRAEQYMAERNVAQLQAQREVGETMRKLHAIADGTKIRPACDWPGNCQHQLTSHRKKN